MITIGYQSDTGAWVGERLSEPYRFGSGRLVPAASLPDLTFPVRERAGRVGPLVGVLVSESSIPALLVGKKRWLETVVRSVHNAGGIAIVTTAAGVKENTVSGFVLVPASGRWIKASTPLPDVVYNRVKSRAEESDKRFQTAAARFDAGGIALINRSFFRKSDVYDALRADGRLWPHLLPTAPVRTADDVRAWLNRYSCVYVKKDDGAKGNGLFRLTVLPDRSVLCEHPGGRKRLRSLEALAPLLESGGYIAQAAARTDTWNGQRYDLRVLAHWRRGRYTMTGVGVRLAARRALTTHVFHGGTILPYAEVEKRIDEASLAQLIALSGERLSERFGFVGEFSADIGVGPNYELYVYEMNAKPMSFDEPDIEKRRLERLNELFASFAQLAP